MSTANRATERLRQFQGVKESLAQEVLTPGDLTSCTNYLLKLGALEKVGGAGIFRDNFGTNRVYIMGRFKNYWFGRIGTTLVLFSGNTSLTNSATITRDSNTLDNSTTGLSDRIESFDAWENKLYFTLEGQGTNTGAVHYLKEVSSNTYQLSILGLSPPANWTAGDITVAFGSGSWTIGDYYYLCTYYDSTTGTESVGNGAVVDDVGLYIGDVTTKLGSISSSTVVPDTDRNLGPRPYFVNVGAVNNEVTINLTNVKVNAPPRADRIRIYRSIADSATSFMLVAELPIATNSYVDQGSIVGVDAGINTNPGPPSMSAYASTLGSSSANCTPPQFVRQHKAQLFIYGASFNGGLPTGFSSTYVPYYPSADSILYVSDTDKPDYIIGVYTVSNGDGQAPTGVAVLFHNYIILFKESSIYYLAGQGPDGYTVRPMDMKRGCFVPRSIQETPQGVVALDRSGVILVDNIGPAKDLQSQEIRDFIQTINWGATDAFYSSYDRENKRYYLGVPTGASTKADTIMVFSFVDNGWTFIYNQKVWGLAFGYGSDQAQYAVGGDDNGRIVSMFRTDLQKYINSPINARLVSGPFYVGDPDHKKKAKWLYIKARSKTDWTINIEIIPDWGQGQSFTLNDINSSSLYAVYASSQSDTGSHVGIWDSSFWSGATIPVTVKIPISCIGRSFQVAITHKFSTDDSQTNFRIDSIALECVMMGR